MKTTFPRLWALLGHITLILLRLTLPVAVLLAFVFGVDWDRPGDDADAGGFLLWVLVMVPIGVVWCGVIFGQLGLSGERLLHWWRARSAGGEEEIRAATLALHPPKSWRWAVSVSLFVLFVSAGSLSPSNPRFRPLPKQAVSPTDEEMIDHFEANRETFEEIVRYYRTRLFVGQDTYDYQDYRLGGREPPKLRKIGMDALMRRADVWFLGPNTIRPDLWGALWRPDPYAPDDDARRARLEKLREQCLGDDPANRQAVCDPGGPQYVELAIGRKGRFNKSWVHFPEAPRIEDGYLLPPGYRPGGRRGYRRVYDSLSVTPPRWYENRCVYRRIDAHWFLQMCRPDSRIGG